MLHSRFSGAVLGPSTVFIASLWHYAGFIVRSIAFALAIQLFGRLFAGAQRSFALRTVISCICFSSVADYLLILAIIWPQYPPIYRTVLSIYVLVSQSVGLQGTTSRLDLSTSDVVTLLRVLRKRSIVRPIYRIHCDAACIRTRGAVDSQLDDSRYAVLYVRSQDTLMLTFTSRCNCMSKEMQVRNDLRSTSPHQFFCFQFFFPLHSTWPALCRGKKEKALGGGKKIVRQPGNSS